MEFICDNEKENWEPGDEASLRYFYINSCVSYTCMPMSLARPGSVCMYSTNIIQGHNYEASQHKTSLLRPPLYNG